VQWGFVSLTTCITEFISKVDGVVPELESDVWYGASGMVLASTGGVDG